MGRRGQRPSKWTRIWPDGIPAPSCLPLAIAWVFSRRPMANGPVASLSPATPAVARRFPEPGAAPAAAGHRWRHRRPRSRRRGGANEASSASCGLRCRGGGAAALGLSLAVGSRLPVTGRAALSISSGYETFLVQIRGRIVCAEDDVFDEVAERGQAQPCDSMRDGPFCRGLPAMGTAGARYQPFTVDSIVPQHLFGQRRGGRSGSGAASPFSMDDEGNEASATSSSSAIDVNKQAAATLSKFLEPQFFNEELSKRRPAVEGRLRFSSLLPGRPAGRELGFTAGFSAGLPGDVTASWGGAWQAEHTARGVSSRGPRQRSSHGEPLSASLRLNGAVGSIHFSRPVVLRQLLVRPPLGASVGRHRLLVRGRKDRKEAWRREYDYDAQRGVASVPRCAVGDMVMAKYGETPHYYLATVLATDGALATLRWTDDDHAHRVVSLRYVTTADGVPCPGPLLTGVSPEEDSQVLWRDLARRVKAVDEVSFTVLRGDAGWLLADLSVAAMGPLLEKYREEDVDSAHKDLADPSSHVVQVLPGPYAIISEVSRAAVLFNADDMLQRGLRLRSAWRSANTLSAMSLQSEPVSQDDDEDSESTKLRLSPLRSLEGVKRLLWALSEPADSSRFAMRLPAGISRELFLKDTQRMVTALSASKPEVKRYGHFEVFFSALWDWRVAADALQATFERWRIDPAQQAEAAGAFIEGQRWTGSYFCTQGATMLALDITQVALQEELEHVRAELSFWVDEQDKQVRGAYAVAGTLEPEGRVLSLEPVPGSWKDRPDNFVMVGLQGVVSRFSQPPAISGAATVEMLRFAGSVPIFGCDSFELRMEVPPSAPSQPEAASTAQVILPQPDVGTNLWNGALSRLSRSIDMARERWWVHLQQLTSEKSSSAKTKEAVAQQMAAQLVQGMQSGQLPTSLEVTTADGEEIIVQIAQAGHDLVAQLR